MRSQTNILAYEAVQEFLKCMETQKKSSPRLRKKYRFNMNLLCRSSYCLKRIRGFNMNQRCESSLLCGAVTEYQKELMSASRNSTAPTSSHSVSGSSANNEVSFATSPLPPKLYNLDQALDRYHQSLYAWLHTDKQSVPEQGQNWPDQILKVFHKMRN